MHLGAGVQTSALRRNYVIGDLQSAANTQKYFLYDYHKIIKVKASHTRYQRSCSEC